MSEFRYKAFISYSWPDQKWSRWLHHAIETYRPPKDLIGSTGLHGPVPARLMPVFKDRDEEAAGASISQAIEDALAASEFLIVICSPRSAKSRWVNHEVAWFKTNRSPANILALIIDGDPDASDPSLYCFPKALTHHVTPMLAVTDIAQPPPLAADARRVGDGRRLALLKIAAALLGVGLDDLVRRDESRRARLRLIVSSGSTALALVMGVLAWTATTARNEAVFQRNEAQDLTEFMLTDLRERLDEVGRLDILDTVGKRLMRSYDRQNPAKLDADALGRRARVQLLLGEIEGNRGNLVLALSIYRRAEATTAELLSRQPDSQQRQFDHAQSLYWVGYVAWQRGDFGTARRQFEAYDRLADRLVAADPGNFDWQLEKSYAQSNLGTVAADQGYLDAARQHFATALAIDSRFYKRNPRNTGAIIQYGNTLSWVARVATRSYRFQDAERTYARAAALYRDALAANPNNRVLLTQLTLVTTQHARALMDLGQADAATADADRAVVLARALLAADPDNALNAEYLAKAYLSSGQIAAAERDVDSAVRHANLAMTAVIPRGKRRDDATSARLEVADAARLVLAEAALASGARAEAEALCRQVIAAVSGRDLVAAGSTDMLMFVEANAMMARMTGDARHWQAITDRMQGAAGTPLAATAASQAAALIAAGREAEGRAIRDGLQQAGYAHPRFKSNELLSKG